MQEAFFLYGPASAASLNPEEASCKDLEKQIPLSGSLSCHCQARGCESRACVATCVDASSSGCAHHCHVAQYGLAATTRRLYGCHPG